MSIIYSTSDLLTSVGYDEDFRFKVTNSVLFGEPTIKVKFQKRGFLGFWWNLNERSTWGCETAEANREVIALLAQDMFSAYHLTNRKWDAINKTFGGTNAGTE